jgi:1A family penicillin-binding protein
MTKSFLLFNQQMPIPQLNRVPQQSWRSQQNKYSPSKKTTRLSPVLNLKRGGSSMPPSRKPKRNILGKNLKKNLLSGVAILILLGFLSGLGVIAWFSRGLPEPGQLIDRELAQSTKIYDRTGEQLLYEIHGDQQRTLVTLTEMPEYVKWATVAIEDKDFYHHKGFSLWAIARTAFTNVIRGEKAGASTLTQQLVKNAMLTSEKRYSRKIREVLLAYKMEKKFAKDEILQMYLNEIPYGSTAYGVEAAAQRYFAKSVRDISLAEAAVLAALPQGPSRYSPYGQNLDLLIGRQQYILDQMVEQGYISEDDAEVAKAQDLEFKKQQSNIKAPHFVMYIKEKLEGRYGIKAVEQGGYKIITTLDLYKQEIAEEVITEQAEARLTDYEASNASLVSIDPKTGQILAMVGSKDYFNDEIDGQVNIATSLRQPGSSMKPLVYASSFIKGYTPDTILYDVVTNFSNDEANPYEPNNYDLKEHGPVSIRKALAGSLNVPAVKAIYLSGVSNVTDLATDIGYTSLNDPDRYGFSLVLGGAEVKLLEHTNAFAAFAREGLVNPVTGILRVEDSEGNVLEEFEQNDKKVLDGNIARMVNDILSDNNARAYAFGTQNWLTLGSRPVAAKTGTTNDYRDAWTIGYTPSIVTGVWVGNNDNTEMKRGAAGGVVAAPIWHDYMQKVLGDTPIEQFKKPDIKKTGKAVLDGEVGAPTIVRIDKVSGKLASEFTPPELIEEKMFFEPHSILYYVDKDDPTGDIPENPANDPQFNLWEERVLAWAEKEAASSTTASSTFIFSSDAPPTEVDDVHLPENIPDLRVITPSNNQVQLEKTLSVRIDTDSKLGVERVEYYLNDNLFRTETQSPFYLDQDISFLNNGYHKLTVRSCDEYSNCKSAEVEFNLILDRTLTVTDSEISLSSPLNGLAVNNIDFPLLINGSLTQPIAVARVDLFYINENDEKVFIDSVQPINSPNYSTTWPEAPQSGAYRIKAEAVLWNGNVRNSELTTVVVNNPNN